MIERPMFLRGSERERKKDMTLYGNGNPRHPDRLNIEVETIRKVRYDNLERFLCQMYGLDSNHVSLIDDFEWHNDSQYEISLGDGIFFTDDEYDAEDRLRCVTLIMGGQVDEVPHSGFLLDYACALGLIHPGKYTVDVMW